MLAVKGDNLNRRTFCCAPGREVPVTMRQHVEVENELNSVSRELDSKMKGQLSPADIFSRPVLWHAPVGDALLTLLSRKGALTHDVEI